MTEKVRPRRGRPANEALGQTVVDAACELFVELGFEATILDKVAQLAKISTLRIYRHFKNKEGLPMANLICVPCSTSTLAPTALHYSNQSGMLFRRAQNLVLE